LKTIYPTFYLTHLYKIKTRYFFLLYLVFNNIQLHAQLVYNNGATIAIKTGATVIVRTGSVSNFTGLIDNAGTLQIEGTFTNAATANGGGANGIYKIQNNWINNGTFNANNSQVELYGANQFISGTSITDFYQLTITGTGIKTQTVDARVLNLLELNDRELATDNFKMTILSTNVNAITRTTGFVSSLGNGRLSRLMASTGIYNFPVGSSIGVSRYRPLNITPSSNAPQQYDVRLANVDANVEGFNRNTRAADICEINPNYFHHINRINGSTPVDLNFFYDPLSDGTWVSVAHWQNLPEWQNTSPITAGVSAPFNTLTILSWNDFSFSPFALVNLGPDATINGTTTFCAGASTIITFTGTPNAVISYNINGGSTQTITLNAFGNATLNTGNLFATTVFNLVSAVLPATPSCVHPFTTQVTVTVTPNPSISPVYHD
jgi:hypothetical protein